MLINSSKRILSHYEVLENTHKTNDATNLITEASIDNLRTIDLKTKAKVETLIIVGLILIISMIVFTICVVKPAVIKFDALKKLLIYIDLGIWALSGIVLLILGTHLAIKARRSVTGIGTDADICSVVGTATSRKNSALNAETLASYNILIEQMLDDKYKYKTIRNHLRDFGTFINPEIEEITLEECVPETLDLIESINATKSIIEAHMHTEGTSNRINQDSAIALYKNFNKLNKIISNFDTRNHRLPKNQRYKFLEDFYVMAKEICLQSSLLVLSHLSTNRYTSELTNIQIKKLLVSSTVCFRDMCNQLEYQFPMNEDGKVYRESLFKYMGFSEYRKLSIQQLNNYLYLIPASEAAVLLLRYKGLNSSSFYGARCSNNLEDTFPEIIPLNTLINLNDTDGSKYLEEIQANLTQTMRKALKTFVLQEALMSVAKY